MSALNYPYKQTFRQGFKLFSTLCLLMGMLFIFKSSAQAEDCDEISDLDDRAECLAEEIEKKEEESTSISKKISEIKDEMKKISGKIAELASQISITQEEIGQLQAEITSLDKAITKLNETLANRRGTLEEKETLRDTAIRSWAKKSAVNNWERFAEGIGTLEGNFGLNGFEYLTFNYLFDKALNEDSLKWIKALAEEIAGYEKDKQEALDLKTEIATEQQNLLNIKTQLANKQKEEEEVKGALSEEQEKKEKKLLSLEEEIARLSEEQQKVIDLKSGGSSISGYEAPSYKLPDPPFKPAFALMSYGAFTHRRGMSQYGAKGRAEDGQKYEDILEFYYEEKVEEKEGFPKKVCVEGYGDMEFQKYLYGLAEMPSSWPKEALKAQAVAGRTYAYKYAKDGKCICTSQSCQVFLKSKSDNPPDAWKKAVDDTKNEILGGDTTAYYSSTTGGWIQGIGWDADGDWPGDAYEKKAKSPWFYKAWYNHPKDPNSDNTCGRSTPWLNLEEMTDLLNTWVVWKEGTDSEVKEIYPVSRTCWKGEGYSMKDMAKKAEKYGEKYTNISGISNPSISDGKTKEICFDTNLGKKCVDGQEFAYVVYMRAPGYIRIERDVFKKTFLYDIEFEK